LKQKKAVVNHGLIKQKSRGQPLRSAHGSIDTSGHELSRQTSLKKLKKAKKENIRLLIMLNFISILSKQV